MKVELFKNTAKMPFCKGEVPIFICTFLCGSGFMYIAKAKPFLLSATHKVFGLQMIQLVYK